MTPRRGSPSLQVTRGASGLNVDEGLYSGQKNSSPFPVGGMRVVKYIRPSVSRWFLSATRRMISSESTPFQSPGGQVNGPDSQLFVQPGIEPSTVYVNPICLQMDQLIMKAETPEDVLTLLVTHRGALFLHNLITSLSTLAQMSSESIPFEKSKGMKFPAEFKKVTQDRLLSDPRYMVLVSDLIDGSSNLDLQSIEIILRDLRTLDHCHYKLIGALLRRLYAIDLNPENLHLAVSIGQTLDWGGFGKAETFFKRLSSLVISEAYSMDSRTLLNALVLFSKLPTCYVEALDAACSTLPNFLSSLKSSHLGISAVAVSEYGGSVPSAQRAIRLIADAALERVNECGIRDLVRVAVGLRRVNVEHRELLQTAWNITINELKSSFDIKERMDPSIASISDLATLVDSCAHFGFCESSDFSNFILPYVSEHIDLVTEEAAIKLLFGLASAPQAVTPKHAPDVALLMRKIGAATDSWERHKMKIMSIFFSKVMEFDFVDSQFRKFIIDSSLAHWLMARRGYGVPYPETSEWLFKALQMELSNVDCRFNAWIPNSPFNADILIVDHRIAVLVLSKFSDQGNPVGSDLLQVNLVKRLGWTVIPIDYRKISIAGPTVAGAILNRLQLGQ